MLSPIGIVGMGHYVPERRVLNEAITEKLGVTSEWIEQRTGIRSRHYAQSHESASQFAIQAAERALQASKIKASQLDMIIGCTSSRDDLFPPLAAKVQHYLGAKEVAAFDLTAGATGFQIGLTLAASHLSCKDSKGHILIVGSSLFSRYLNWSDPKSAVLFGDGAGAAVVSQVPNKYGILASKFLSDGSAYEAFRLQSGGMIEMDGMKVAAHFLKSMPRVIRGVLESAGLSVEKVDLFIFHQANLRLIHALMDSMKITRSKTFTNVDKFGNTADASLPIAVSEAFNEGLLKRDSLVVIAGAGPGGIYGASVVRWY